MSIFLFIIEIIGLMLAVFIFFAGFITVFWLIKEMFEDYIRSIK